MACGFGCKCGVWVWVRVCEYVQRVGVGVSVGISAMSIYHSYASLMHVCIGAGLSVRGLWVRV